MARRSFARVPDHALLRDLAALVARDRSATAEMLDHIAEVDDRKLFAPAGYSSMYQYCVSELHMSEDSALKRLRAARAARDFPVIFEMVEDGRLHLTAVVFLAPHLTHENAAELLAGSANRTKAEIELLLAERFPKADVPSSLEPIESPAAKASHGAVSADARTRRTDPDETDFGNGVLVPEPPVPSNHQDPPHAQVPLSPAARVSPSPSHTRVAPLSPGRYELRTTLDQATHDKLRRVQELLSHAVPSGDIAAVLGRALELALNTLEKRKFAATSRPSAKRRSRSARHIPAHVRREVSDRDRYQCTFVSDKGRRCAEKRFLEFDHVHPVARGGQATVENTRLRCRAHNQYEAERVYGAGFMREKREAARARGESARKQAAARTECSQSRDGGCHAPSA